MFWHPQESIFILHILKRHTVCSWVSEYVYAHIDMRICVCVHRHSALNKSKDPQEFSKHSQLPCNAPYRLPLFCRSKEPYSLWKEARSSVKRPMCYVVGWQLRLRNQMWRVWAAWWRDKGMSKELQVSFAKEPYKRDDILLKRPIMWRDRGVSKDASLSL